MAQYGKDFESFSAARTVRITSAEKVDNYTTYVIEVTIGQYSWTVSHRYSEFNDLHDKLVSHHNMEKGLLPPKKLVGNKSEAFIRKRQGELEIYLQTILHHLPTMPAALAAFLDFPRYEIHGITQTLAEELYEKGDLILQASETFHITPLQLNAIASRLKLAEPTCDSGDARKDLGHVLDFITRLKYLKIIGTKDPVGSSNIDMNQLSYDLVNFRSLSMLQVSNCNPTMMTGLDNVKRILKTLRVQQSLSAIKEMLLQDVPYWQTDDDLVPKWLTLTSADFSHNDIDAIDNSVKLMPHVEFLDLSHNKLEEIEHLQHLFALIRLNLSHNNIKLLNNLHMKLGNIKILNLAANKLESLQGLSKLYSLETLNVSNNEISQVLEITNICNLPCLENLMLSGNPVTIVLDYRTRILELFGERARELILDSQRPTQKELDTVAVLQAIQKSKQGKDSAKKHAMKKPATEAAIAESSPQHSTQSQASQSTVMGWSITDAHSLTSDPELFRLQVESIREQGGDAWLQMLNQMQPPASPAQPQDTFGESAAIGCCWEAGHPREEAAIGAGIKEGGATSTEVPQAPKDGDIKGQTEGACASENDDVPPAEQPVTSQPPSSQPVICQPGACQDGYVQPAALQRTLLLPPDLPTMADKNLVAHILSKVPSTTSLGHAVGEGYDVPVRDEIPILIMWCPYIQYTKPSLEVACCLFLTNDNLHIFEVEALVSQWQGYPKVEHRNCIPLKNIQQIVVGHRHLWVRIEEAFVGPQGTFTFLTANPMPTSQLMSNLHNTYTNTKYGNHGEEPEIVIVSDAAEKKLKQVLNREEKVADSSKIDILLYSFVQTVGLDAEGQLSTHTLILTPNNLFLVKEDCIHGPPPTFALESSLLKEFKIVDSYPINGKVTEIDLYDAKSMGLVLDNSEGEGISAFIGFGVRLTFEMPEEEAQSSSIRFKRLDIRVASSNLRDLFLGTLTQVRRDYAAKMAVDGPSSPRKSSSATATREDSLKKTQKGNAVKGRKLTSMGKEFQNKKSRLPPPSQLLLKTPDGVGAGYPSMDLIEHLSACNEGSQVLVPMSAGMKNLASMSGEELLNYFHSSIAQIGHDNEELRHLLWSSVILYHSPKREILTCIMLSTKAMYLLSDEDLRALSPAASSSTSSPGSWRKTHARHRSDPTLSRQNVRSHDLHHTSGILHKGDEKCQQGVQMYQMLPLRLLKAVNIGLFDQSFRISGVCVESIFTCVTRDFYLTEGFIKQLMSVLLLYTPSPSPDITSSDSEQDFYKMFAEKSCSENMEFVHPSKVKFFYPNEDSVMDLTYMILEHIPGLKPSPSEISILLYLLSYQVSAQGLNAEGGRLELGLDMANAKPCTLILTTQYILLAIEDHVSYPLPESVKSPPEMLHYQVIDIRNIEYLKRIVVSDFTSHDVMFIFSDDTDEIIVDASLDYYTAEGGAEDKSRPEVSWVIAIQSQRDKDRLLKLITRQWNDIHDGKELSVQVNA